MTVYEGPIRVSSPYGPRTSPISGKSEHHNGKDMVGLQSKVQRLVVSQGRVLAVNTGYQGGRGNNVVIQSVDDPHRPGTDVRLRYQHQACTALKVGQVLACGDVVGTEGSTGDSTGSHCHFEITVNGVVVDPSPWDGLPNRAGTYAGNSSDAAGAGKEEGVTMLEIFTATSAGLEVFSEADIYATIPDGNGTLRLAPGRYAVHETAPLAGSTLLGVKIRYQSGKLGWAARLAGKYTLASVTLAQAEADGLVGLAPAAETQQAPDSIRLETAKKAARAAAEACCTAAEAANHTLNILEG